MKDLRSGIEHLKQAKAHMSKANGIMSDHISKLKALEEENAELRAELDDRKDNAEGFRPDAYMKLPVDADGVPIRFCDVVWYVGSDTEIEKDCPLKVAGFVTIFAALGIFIETREYPDKAIDPESLTHKQPEPSDSWEKLEADMMKGTTCFYFGCEESKEDCFSCPHGIEKSGMPCWKNERVDILKRAKKLAGIEEEAER